MDLKNLDLTEQDFKLLIDGLENLPNRDLPGEMLGELMLSVAYDGSPAALARIKAERDIKFKKEKAAKEQLKEDVKILQGKLLMFKRYLIEQNALKQAHDILGS